MAKATQPKWNNLAELLADLNARQVTDYRRYKEVRDFLNMKARRLGVPLIGTFELTPLCNLDCKMCYVHLTKEQMGDRKLLPVETWINLIDQAYDAGMLYATLTGGECLTYPGFREVYLHLRSKGVETAVLTNGLLITEEMVGFFKANPPAFIQLSVYGSDEDAYERVTGHRVYGKVMETVKRINDAGIPLDIAITPSLYMAGDTEKLIRQIYDMGIHFNTNPALFSARENTGREAEENDAPLDEYVRIKKLEASLSGHEITPCLFEDLPSQRTGTGEQKGIRCGAGRSAFCISWTGEMQACNVMKDIYAQPLVDGFPAAWRTINQRAVNFPLPVECQGCQYEHICKHCVAEHLQGAECGHANPLICAWGERMVREGLLALSEE